MFTDKKQWRKGSEKYNEESGAYNEEKTQNKYENERSAEKEKNSVQSRLFEKWNEGIEEVMSIVPDFDFAQALQNSEFYKALCSGMSVPGAYLKVKLSAEKETKESRTKNRIPENGTMRAAAGGRTRRNPADMSEKNFGEYIKNIMGKQSV